MSSLIEYDTNNSGGDWWLDDKDWFALEAAGWTVKWNTADKGFGSALSEDPELPGKYRWLGGLAHRASKEGFTSFADGIREFEQVTGQSATDDGCNCCGPPHSFEWFPAGREGTAPRDVEYVSGEDVCSILYGPDAPTSLREALERD